MPAKIHATSSSGPEMKVLHIPTLENANECQRLLQRIYNEFYPIIQRRGYNVISLSEMCCCSDGLDHDSSSRRRRKTRTMGDQVHGYNMTQWRGGQKVHAIHVRMRDPRNHSVLFSYEHVAGTMAHELAHCVHGAHSATFYKLMDEILDQHATFLSKGIVADQQGFPMGSNQAYTLGGSSNKKDTHNAALEAAQRRMQQQRWMPQGPQKLGGDGGFRTLLGPQQAAEARRLRDEVWCQPCQDDSDDVVELSSDSEEEVDDDRKPAAKSNESSSGNENGNDDQKSAALGTDSDKENATGSRNQDSDATDGKPSASAAARPASASAVETIDLTGSDDEDDIITTTQLPVFRGRRKRSHQDTQDDDDGGDWSCTQCTFKNLAGTLVCGMCGKESPLALAKTKKIVAEIQKTDVIEQVQKAEVEQSMNEFGFNIYGNGKQATAKLPHIT